MGDIVSVYALIALSKSFQRFEVMTESRFYSAWVASDVASANHCHYPYLVEGVRVNTPDGGGLIRNSLRTVLRGFLLGIGLSIA